MHIETCETLWDGVGCGCAAGPSRSARGCARVSRGIRRLRHANGERHWSHDRSSRDDRAAWTAGRPRALEEVPVAEVRQRGGTDQLLRLRCMEPGVVAAADLPRGPRGPASPWNDHAPGAAPSACRAPACGKSGLEDGRNVRRCGAHGRVEQRRVAKPAGHGLLPGDVAERVGSRPSNVEHVQGLLERVATCLRAQWSCLSAGRTQRAPA
jgi:hypothetical protein